MRRITRKRLPAAAGLAWTVCLSRRSPRASCRWSLFRPERRRTTMCLWAGAAACRLPGPRSHRRQTRSARDRADRRDWSRGRSAAGRQARGFPPASRLRAGHPPAAGETPWWQSPGRFRRVLVDEVVEIEAIVADRGHSPRLLDEPFEHRPVALIQCVGVQDEVDQPDRQGRVVDPDRAAMNAHLLRL